MEPVNAAHVSLVTLGVRDVARATRFYEELGWRVSAASSPQISFLQGGTVALALFGRDDLAAEAGVELSTSGAAAVALAANLPSEQAVDAVLDGVEDAGGTVIAAASRADWGGYSGYLRDPDGHLWEVAYNPGFPLSGEGRVSLPELPPPPVRIVDAGPADAGELLTLQRAAYVTEAQLHDDVRLPPLLQSLADLEVELVSSIALRALIGARTVGAVRGQVVDRTCHIARLTVAPDVQGRGIGTRLLRALEARVAAEVDGYELFTGPRSEANQRLYERLGYTVVDPGPDDDPDVVVLRRPAPPD